MAHDEQQATSSDPKSRNEAVASLRGAPVGGDLRRAGPWIAIGTGIASFALAVIVVISFLNANATSHRLKVRGIHVDATVTLCIGNLGGSGSTGAGFTCHASYAVQGAHYDQVVTGLTTFRAPGTVIAAVVDPQQPTTIETEQALGASSPSVIPIIVSVLLLLLAIILTGIGIRILRR